MFKRIWLPIIGVVVFIGIISLIKYEEIAVKIGMFTTMKKEGFFESVSVSTAPVTTASWPDTISSVGNIEAIQGTTISPQVAGTISKIHFKSGQEVKKGDLIIELNHNELTAQLEGANAKLHLDQINYQRDKELFKQKVLQQSKIDQDIELIKSDKSSINQLKAQINYHIIKAPFSGKLGIREVSLGQYIAPGNAITTLNIVDPVFVNFNINQQQLAKVQVGQDVHVTVSSYPKHIFAGKITSINNQVSDETKAIKIQATLPNNTPGKILLPNMFSEVSLLTGEAKPHVIIPENAVQYSLYGTSVYVIDRKDKAYNLPTAKQIYIKLGQRYQNSIAVTSGLTSGQEVIVAGGNKITEDHQPVKIINK